MRDLVALRDLVWALVVRGLKVRYRRSTLGFVWTMLQPLLTMVVLTTVFSHAFRFDLPAYPVYALSGLLFWNFFSQAITSSMYSLRGNANLLSKVPVPKAVFPVATLLAGLVNLLLALVPLAVILLVTGHPIRPAIAFVPVSILVAAVFTLGFGLMLSPLAAFFQDLMELVSVVLMMVMYLTPIFYPPAIVPEHYRAWLRWNPVSVVMEVFRDPIYRGELPSASSFGAACLLAGLSLVLGVLAFRRASKRIAFYL